jgi:hypothetical protein
MEAVLTRNAILAMSSQPVDQGVADLLPEHTAIKRDEGGAHVEPQFRFITDQDQQGDGSEFATDQRIDYVERITIPVTGKLNYQTSARMFLRGLGSDVTPSVVAGLGNAGATDYAADMQDKDITTPLFTSIVQILAGANLRMMSFVINSFSIALTGSAPPKFTAELIGSGQHEELTSLIITGEGDTVYDPHVYGSGAFVRFQFNDGALYDVRGDGLLALNIGFSNNCTFKELPGDPTMDGTYEGVAVQIPYPAFIQRGNRTATLSYKTYANALSPIRDHQKSGKLLTAISALFPGPKIPTTGVNYELEYKMSKAKFGNIAPDTEDAYAARTVDLALFPDAITGGLVSGRVRAKTTDQIA